MVSFLSSPVMWPVAPESRYQFGSAPVKEEAMPAIWEFRTKSSSKWYQQLFVVWPTFRQTWQRGWF
jgi:hypothetical protein